MKGAIAATMSLLWLASCSSGGGPTSNNTAGPGIGSWASHQELVEAAKEEGAVKVLTALNEDTSAEIVKGFKGKYPGIDVEFAEAPSGQRVILELRAGTLDYDLVFLELVHYTEAVPYLDEKIDFSALAASGVIDVPKETISPNRRAIAATNGLAVVAYNKKLLPEADVPKTWDDILKPQYKGQFILNINADYIAVLREVWDQDKWAEFGRALGQQKPHWTDADTVSMTLIAAGEYPLMVAGNYHSAYREQLKSPDTIGITFIEPVPVLLHEVDGIPKGAAHPAAATLYLEYLLSPEAQEIIDRIEPKKSSIYVSGSPNAEAVAALDTSVQSWEALDGLAGLVAQLQASWGFPAAKITK
jgi:iron(III) transport system substrate-binding protein